MTSQTMRVLLLVDDDPTDAMLVELALAELDLDVELETIHDGNKALKRLQDGSCPDLLLIDLHMPHMSAVELLEALQDCFPPTRVVVWSASPPRGIEERILALGAEVFLSKPPQYEELVIVLKQLLEPRAGAKPGSG
ncbi:response regulator [Deinococcus hopiensis]|uniref:Response regulator containing CheY-like receiver, AAA-type ATPase, and DNA-binding domains n=1 Tax=Deinococcus hopiensis KR-140 TaxID=695939 RepID=A0A1W1UCN9_9DEIO|nr:response regulator [Deinococcus hopiensis]SMB78865.1 Response regulator containing CheY-like receiver, AAA-type ATPase, and DNA-binding domains [Deinococcus hopiensis KR-140]